MSQSSQNFNSLLCFFLHIENECIHAMYEGKKQAKIMDFFSKD